MATSTQLTGTAVAGYFATGHEAHRAINALIDAGFQQSEIGAAFHAGSGAQMGSETQASAERRPNIGGELREELGTTLTGLSPNRSRATGGGAASDTSSVQYASLGGGAGTPIDGASRPGPIPGTDVLHSGLPSELKHELPHDGDVRSGSADATSMRGQSTETASMREEVGITQGSLATSSIPEEPSTHARATVHESWGERLKHIFGTGDTHRSGSVATQTSGKDDLRAEMRREAQDFGTGEGHLNLTPTRPHSQAAFERSFTGYGIAPERAGAYGRGLSRGGAVVTVHAGARTAEAERILEAHGGTAHLTETGVGSSTDVSEVEVLGTLGRDYTGYPS